MKGLIFLGGALAGAMLAIYCTPDRVETLRTRLKVLAERGEDYAMKKFEELEQNVKK